MLQSATQGRHKQKTHKNINEAKMIGNILGKQGMAHMNIYKNEFLVEILRKSLR